MSCKRTEEFFSPIEIKITCIDRKALTEIESKAIGALSQKMDKLKILLKNLDVYCLDDALLVNDRFGIYKDLAEIVQAFGFEVKQIACGLKGRSYLLQDELVELIRTIDPQFTLEKYASAQSTAELGELIKKEATHGVPVPELIKILSVIKEQGYYSVSGTQKETRTYYDGVVIDCKKEVVSGRDQVEAVLEKFTEDTTALLEKANGDIRDGTVRLLYHRARQMGYSVKEERNGAQVQLVLVRCD